MSAEKKIDNQQVVGPTILAGCMGFMMICAWAFASPNAFKRPTIDVQLTENVDSQTEEIQVTETPETETNRATTEPESSTTTIETTDTQITISSEQPTTDTTETPTNTETIQVTATSQPEPETPTSQPQGKSLTQPKTLGQVKFGFNAVELSFPAEQTINGFISEIKEYDPNKVAIKVEGHTSRVGDSQLNQLISQDRADAVVEYIKGQNLLHQVVGEGVGYSQPLPGTDPAADINQRTVIILTPAN